MAVNDTNLPTEEVITKALRIHGSDNVAVAVVPLAKGTELTVQGITVITAADIPMGHKIALQDIPEGVNIVKYGYPIGRAKTAIKAGDWVHSHNVQSNLGELLNYTYEPVAKVTESAENIGASNDTATNGAMAEVMGTKESTYTFEGYKRDDGSVGIRNEVWIIPTVGCVNGIVKTLERMAKEFPQENVDGIYAYAHPHGCSQLGDDQLHTQRILSGLVHNPNAGAVLVVGLGCENNQISLLKEVIGDYDPDRVKFMTCQAVEDEIETGMELLEDLVAYANRFTRTTCPASALTIGLKCGGSDGFSGITANPLVGDLSNRIIEAGGTSILTEVPEMFGAETILMNRCRNQEVFEKTVQLINNFKTYFKSYGEEIDENPSPGNKAGGITTLEDKSLGCVQKAGDAIVEDVLAYGERVHHKGLNLLQAPGNDLVAANALAAAGAQLVLFTTGRGTPFASPVPTVKIASNSKLANFKKNWIDFNAGTLLTGETMESLGDRFLQYILDVASGRTHVRAEALDKSELAIFKDGVTL
ncbi:MULTISPECIES: UxaA family hydrolase [Veillonella]|uniref:UxaA family hydrolase n=1 Tax=Veillonella TaxID=29465 RepID=UPI0025D6F089|nr:MULTISPECIES: altronate dehydratase family protein [Veillonella]